MVELPAVRRLAERTTVLVGARHAEPNEQAEELLVGLLRRRAPAVACLRPRAPGAAPEADYPLPGQRLPLRRR